MSSSLVVLIAGVTGGIGSDLARRLTVAGWQVAGYARSADRLAALRAELPALVTHACDATINRPKDSDFDLPGSRERQRVVIRPLAGARGYRKVQRSKGVGLSSRWNWTEALPGSSVDDFSMEGVFLSSNG